MKKIKFKLIPFIISLAIVIGSVAGIMLYSYYSYDANKLRFVADYFHYEDYKSIETEKQLDDFIKMTSHAYKKVDSGLKYFDVDSKKEYTSTPSESSLDFIEGAKFENGVLHLPGYFDLAMYAESSWNTDSKEWIFSYYVYLYNVNYNNININNLYFAFVNGTEESHETELYGTTKLDMIIDEVKNGENGTPNTTNLPSYQYTGEVSSSYTMYVHDNNATGKGITEDNIPYVYRLTSLQESPSESSDLDNEDDLSKSFANLKSATFSIFSSGDKSIEENLTAGTKLDDLEEIVRGEYVNQYKNVDEFNTLAKNKQQNVVLGYDKDIYKAPYFNFIIGRLLIEGAVTLVISGILAVLFYLIWQEDPEDKSKPNKIKAPKPKRK